uniref:Snurportin-1 n=1 Tax=Ceratitis capitata TaxID=7213 RepID=W8C9M8_CERCA
MFRDLYKQSGKCKIELQEERRCRLLEEQKRRRMILQDSQRDILTYKVIESSKINSKQLQDAYGSTYSVQLSEWLRESPENLCDWVMVPCPKGQRCLIVAENGRTEMYTKSGRRRMTFRTLLPGDNGPRSNKMCTILDCIFSDDKNAFYVLDAIVYGNQELVHCEAQFRFFWLRSKFDECPDLHDYSVLNEKPLKFLERFDAERIANVTEALQRYPFWPDNNPELDGWLFYHKESSYTCGRTPLVGWLFTFMIPDVLGIPVNQSYEKPSNYIEPISFMEEFDEKLANIRRKQRRKSYNPGEMEILESCDTEREQPGETANNDLLSTECILEFDKPVERFLCD